MPGMPARAAGCRIGTLGVVLWVPFNGASWVNIPKTLRAPCDNAPFEHKVQLFGC